MPTTLLLELLPKFIVGVALALLLFFGYNHIKQIGYNEAEAKYTQIMQTYRDNVDKKIDTVVTMSGDIAYNNKLSNEQLTNDVAAILAKVKAKPLVVVKNGDCTPSQTFSDSIGEINKRVNQNMKESQK